VDLFDGITASQLEFTRNVNNLELNLIGILGAELVSPWGS